MDLDSMMVAELVSKLILFGVFAYLYVIRREPFMGAWTLGWGASAFLNLGNLAFAPEGPVARLVGTSAMLAAAGAFLWGGGVLSDRKPGKIWGAAFGAGLLWLIIAELSSLPPLAYLWPLSLLLGAALIYVGSTLIRHSGVSGFEPWLAGGALAIWGLHVMDYPLLSPIRGIAPYGYLLSFALQLTAALGMLLLYLRRYHERLHQSEAQLAQARKMEALGRLAGGVAHDFNNLLTVIMGNLSMMQPSRDDEELVRDAETAALRASELTNQLLSFSRNQVSASKQIDLAAAAHSVGRMLERLIGEDIALEIDAPQSCLVDIDPGHAEQILMNLAINARDAMQHGGRLRISLRPVELQSPWAWVGGELVPGRYVEVLVEDEGGGIPEEVLPHVFDPFFTTKAAGEGTGLGLSIVRGLIEKSGGGIDVEIRSGRGTKFKLLFPLSMARAESLPATAAIVGARSNEEIFVVEDDPAVRSLIDRALRGMGYRVRLATSGEDALRCLGDSPSSDVALLLTDVVLPEHSGALVAERFRRLYPDAAVILMSGYTAGRLRSIPVGCRFLAKPFSAEVLARVVREALDGRPVSTPPLGASPEPSPLSAT